MATGKGTKKDPWVLQTPPGTSEYATLMEALGMVELEHNSRNNRMRAK